MKDYGSDSDNGSKTMYKATCSDCGKECEVPFEPTEGRPVRCMDCFKKSRPQRSFNGGGGGGSRFGGGNRFGGGSRFGGGRSSSFNRGPRQMFKATCSDCGKECEVPFKPQEGKAVRCQDCFRKSKENSDSF